jgi:hypothetical protein
VTWRRKRGERGAALIEFAIIVPVLFSILFGIIDWGNVYSNYLSVRGGTRDAARQASVGTFGGNSSCSLTNAGGNTQTQQIMCLAKSRIGISDSNLRTDVIVDSAGYTVGNSIVVCAEYPATSLSGFMQPFLNGHFVTAKVQMRIESVAGTAPTSGQEDPPTSGGSAGNWGFCTLS